MARVVIEHLTKVFDGPTGRVIRALADVSLTVEDKELMVLVGPSGCGKTTLLRLISGLDEVTEGEISIGGKPMKNVPPGDRDIAMVFQNHALYPHMSAYENMAFGLRVRKFARRDIESRVNETAEMLDLMDCLQRKPKELSGGQRQRVALGRAIVRRPEVFLFDEPLSNLDAQMRVQMRTEIARLHKRLEATMIYVTHDQIEAMTIGNRIAVMNRGVIEQVGEPLSVYERPANLYVAGFIGSPRMNLFEAMVTQKNGSLYVEEPSAGNSELIEPRISVRLKDETASLLNSYKGKKIVFGVRPEKIRSAQNMMEAKGLKIEAVVEMVERAGAETFVYLTRGRQPLVLRAAEGECMRENEKRALSFDMAEVQFFDATTGKAIVR